MGRESVRKPVIYITGIAGFIGGRLAQAFDRAGFVVAGVDNFSTGYVENLPVSVLTLNRLLRLDLSRRVAVTKLADHMSAMRLLGDGKLFIVHAAAPAYDANSYLFASLVNQGVVLGTVHILLAAVRARVDRFCNLSSMARYEMVNLDLGKDAFGYNEDDPIGGMTPYGEAKVAAERQVRMICDRFGIPWLNLVFHNVMGRGQQFNNPLRNVASVMLNLALHGQAPVIYGDGTQRRSFTEWDAIETEVLQLILDPRFEGLTLNIGPGPESGITLNELAKIVYRVTSRLTGQPVDSATRPFRYVKTDQRMASMRTAVCSDRRWRMLFGVTSSTDYERVLVEMGRVILARPREFDYSYLRYADLEVPPHLAQRLLRIRY